LPSQPVTEPTTAAPHLTADDRNPATADDADVIEKEWVERIKAIIKETGDDPHQKEQAVSKLQADYLEKRFGVQVKLPQE